MRRGCGRVPYLIIYHNKISDIEYMSREDEDQLSSRYTEVSSNDHYASRQVVDQPEIKFRLTDSKSVFAELPNTNENPRMRVASGTSDESVSLLLKMRRKTKMRMRSATEKSTASSFATAELTSCDIHRCQGSVSNWTRAMRTDRP